VEFTSLEKLAVEPGEKNLSRLEGGTLEKLKRGKGGCGGNFGNIKVPNKTEKGWDLLARWREEETRGESNRELIKWWDARKKYKEPRQFLRKVESRSGISRRSSTQHLQKDTRKKKGLGTWFLGWGRVWP